MPDFFDVVLTQRAARTFLPDDIDDVLVTRILTAATHAPSAENSQPFVFIVVRDPAQRRAIGAITARIWEGGAKDLEAERLAPGFWRDVDRAPQAGWPAPRCSSWSAATPDSPLPPPWTPPSSRPSRICCWPPTPWGWARP